MTENTNLTAGPGPIYDKIPGPFRRWTDGPLRNQLKLDPMVWSSEELELTAGLRGWNATEKADGTNIGISYTGYDVYFGGRTNKAQIPAPLQEYLEQTFPVELLEQQFGDTSVTIYSEGIGPKIQAGGGLYGPVRAVIFDVRIGNLWLRRSDVEDVASSLGVGTVPLELE